MSESQSSLPEFDKDDEDAVELLHAMVGFEALLSVDFYPTFSEFLEKYNMRDSLISLLENLIVRLKEGSF